jgi:hypothetical protein
MSTVQTPSDYKEYFYKKFIGIFKSLIEKLLIILPNESDEYNNLLKINNLVEKLNFDKIITKMSTNTKLMEVIVFMSKNNFNNEICNKFLNQNEKYWSLMPSFNINKILLLLDNDNKEFVKEQLNNLHICSITYSKVIEQINSSNSESFNPFDSIGQIADNIDINTLFNGVEVKNISAYEMLMESIINQQMDNKMSDYSTCLDNINLFSL